MKLRVASVRSFSPLSDRPSSGVIALMGRYLGHTILKVADGMVMMDHDDTGSDECLVFQKGAHATQSLSQANYQPGAKRVKRPKTKDQANTTSHMVARRKLTLLLRGS